MTKSPTAYPTDLNDSEWARIAPHLPLRPALGRRRIHSERDILNALFYLLKNGCTWRCLPHDFPAWQSVYAYFRKWQRSRAWQRINQEISQLLRRKLGHAAQPSWLVLDSQSVKSAEGGQERGYDGGKKVRGRKRNLVVDSLGLLVQAKVTSASLQDVHAGQEVLERLAQHPDLLTRLQKIIADGAYRGELVHWVQEHLQAELEMVLRPKGQKGFALLPKRWVIERTFAWLSRQRRLARDYERLVSTCEAFLYLSMLRLCVRRLAAV